MPAHIRSPVARAPVHATAPTVDPDPRISSSTAVNLLLNTETSKSLAYLLSAAGSQTTLQQCSMASPIAGLEPSQQRMPDSRLTIESPAFFAGSEMAGRPAA